MHFTSNEHLLNLRIKVFVRTKVFLISHNVITSEVPFLPRDGQNHLQHLLQLPTEGWMARLSGLDKYLDGRPAKGHHQF